MFEVKEYDVSGALLSTYVESDGRLHQIRQSELKNNNAKIEESHASLGLLRIWLEIFLPAGYPKSVTEDYLPYKIYDALQTLTSTIAGLLANRAVLQGVGVGDATATATGALLLSVFQDSAGRIATILFAHRLGSSIEPECKRYRLAADIFNDAAMVADCLSPAFPKPLRIMTLCTASVMRALCGVAAGSSKATLTAHFAKSGNLGEINAKDASQGNAISLLGMLLGSLVVSYVTSSLATWLAMLLLLSAHLSLNYAAVRAVSMQSLNRQRANILFSNLLAYDKILSPKDIATRERVFERDGILRGSNDHVIGSARIGLSLEEVAQNLAANQHSLTKRNRAHASDLAQLMDIFKAEDFIIWFDARNSSVLIVLKQDVSPSSQLKAWCHALLIAEKAAKSNAQDTTTAAVMELIAASLKTTTKLFKDRKQHIVNAGWLIDVTALETQSGVRLVCMH